MAIDADVVIVGAGFSGIGMAMQLDRGGRSSLLILERADDVGGIWRDNVYPGCACDIPSMLYSFSFETRDDWTRHFPPQAEIWSYLRDCVQRRGLRSRIRFGCELVEARYDDAASLWRLRISDGSIVVCRALVLATGALNHPTMPAVPVLDRFEGVAMHSSAWDPGVDLRGATVAVVGTGASAIQIVPEIAARCRRLTLYQRSPAWVLPRSDAPVGGLRRALRRWVPGFARAERAAIYWSLELRAFGFVRNPRVLRIAERLANAHMRRQVKDEALARKLEPDYRLGCKRVLLSDDYYPALCRDNVEVVTTPIAEFRSRSIVTQDGVDRPTDVAIFATGFAATQPLGSMQVRGAGGVTLHDAWRDGMHAYLGTTVAGFPNLFTIVGPNTGLGHNSMIVMMEAQYRYVLDALDLLDRRGARALDVDPAVQARYNEALQRRLAGTVWSSGCRSWYLDDSGKNTTLWPGFTFAFRALTRRVRETDYRLKR